MKKDERRHEGCKMKKGVKIRYNLTTKEETLNNGLF